MTTVVRYNPTTNQFDVENLPSPDLAVMVFVAPDAVQHQPIIGWARPKTGPTNLRIVADQDEDVVAQITPVGPGLELPVYQVTGEFYRVGPESAPLYIHQSRVTYRAA